MWDSDSGNFLGIGSADDLIDVIQSDISTAPAQKDLQSSVAKTITVRKKRFHFDLLILTQVM